MDASSLEKSSNMVAFASSTWTMCRRIGGVHSRCVISPIALQPSHYPKGRATTEQLHSRLWHTLRCVRQLRVTSPVRATAQRASPPRPGRRVKAGGGGMPSWRQAVPVRDLDIQVTFGRHATRAVYIQFAHRWLETGPLARLVLSQLTIDHECFSSRSVYASCGRRAGWPRNLPT